MAYGDNPHDARLKEAWDAYCERLKSASDIIFRDDVPPTTVDRATGFQYIARYIEKSWRHMAEFNTPERPELWMLQNPVSKSFGDNPDCTYHTTWIDGANTHRLFGNRGTVRWISLAVWTEDRKTISVVKNADLQVDEHGNFEVILSPTPQAGNWLKTVPGRAAIWTRQFFGDWHLETPMTLRLERVGATGAPPPPTPEDMVARFERAADSLFWETDRYLNWTTFFRDAPNVFVDKTPPFAGDASQGALGRALQFCYWKVQPDEALVIQVTPPETIFWNYELNNIWWTSPDYRYRLTSLNGQQAVHERDGSVITVVSHTDPGVPNWLDTGGHTEGLINQRWVETDDHPVPTTRLVKRADLESVLPPDAKRFSPDQRIEQLRLRKQGVDRRFPL